MVNFTDFIHMRSSSGLLRKARRLAVKIAHEFNKELPDDYKNIEMQIAFASEDGTYDSFKSLLEEYEKIEKYLHEVYNIENLIVYEVEKRELKNEKEFKDVFKEFFSIIPENSQKKLHICVNYFKEMKEGILKDIMEIRKESRNIRFKTYDYQFFKQVSVMDTKAILEREKRFLIRERHLSVDEKKAQGNIQKSINRIESLFKEYKKNPKKYQDPKEKKKFDDEISKLINQLENSIHKLHNLLLEETTIIKKVCRMFYIFRIRLIHELENSVKKMINKIEKEGFSDKKIVVLRNKLEKLDKVIHEHTLHEEKMAKHELNVLNRGVDVKKQDLKKAA